MSRVLKHLKYPVRYPGIVGRAVENYFHLYALGRPRLRAVEFALNYVCQCTCDHCSAAHLFDRPRRPMSPELVDATLAGLRRLGVMNVNFTGGEALLDRHLDRYVASAGPRSMVVSVASNGIALDAKAADRLRRAGVRIVTLSLDSADPERHDRSRGYEGCFQKVMEATEHCRQRDIDVFWCTILTEENAADGDLEALVDLARRRGVTLTINFSCPVGAWDEKPVGVTPDLRERHRRLMEQPHVRWEGHSNYRREGCPAGIEKLYITADGDVMPCPFIHVSCGSLHEEPVEAIWRRMMDTGPFNEVRDGCPVAEDPTFHVQYLSPKGVGSKLAATPADGDPPKPNRDDALGRVS